MVSKKQAAFSRLVKQHMALHNLKQRQIAAHLGIASSSISRKLNGKHPWTADEQESLRRWWHLDVGSDEPPTPDREEDPTLEAMEQVLLDLRPPKRTEVYKLNVSVLRGLQDQMTPYGQEAYRAFCALVG